MTKAKSAIYGIALNFVSLACSVLISFVLPPLMISRFGKEQYGLWQLLIDVAGFYTLTDFGIGRATTKYMSNHWATGDKGAYMNVLSTSIIANRRLALFAAGLVCLMAAVFPYVFNLGTLSPTFVRVLVLMTGARICVTWLGHAFESIPASQGRFDLLTFMYMVVNVGGGLASLTAVYFGGGLLLQAGIYLSIDVVRRIWQYRLARVLIDFKFSEVLPADPAVRSQLTSYGAKAILIQMAQRVGSMSGGALIANGLDLAQSGAYGLAQGLSTRCRDLSRTLSDLLMPISAQLHTRNDPEIMRRVAIISSRVLGVMCLVFVVNTLILGRQFFDLWIGDKGDPPLVHSVACILIVAALVRLPSVGIAGTLEGIGEMNLLSKISIADAVTTFVCQVVFLRLFGVLGVASAVLVGQLAVNGIWFPILASRVLKLSPLALVARVWIPILGAAVPASATAYAFRTLTPPSLMVGVLFQFSVVSLVLVAAGYFLCLDRAARHSVHESVNGVLARLLRRKSKPKAAQDRASFSPSQAAPPPAPVPDVPEKDPPA